MIFDPKSIGDHHPITIHGESIEQRATYRYLGVYFDNNFSWGTQVEYVCARINQRLHFLRRLRVYGVDKNIMLLFYRATIESVLRYGITTWFGNLTVKLRTQIQRLTNMAGKIIGMPLPASPQEIFEETMIRQSLKITSDPSHVLHTEYQMMPSGRRYRLPNCKRNRYKFSLVPLSIKLLNSKQMIHLCPTALSP